MFTENREFKEKINTCGHVHIFMPEKWANTDRPYNFVPREVRVSFGETNPSLAPTIFFCYFTLENRTLVVSHFKPSHDFTMVNKRVKGLVDAYMDKVLQEFIRHGSLMSVDKLIIKTEMPMAADSFLELGFKAKSEGEKGYVGEYDFKKTRSSLSK